MQAPAPVPPDEPVQPEKAALHEGDAVEIHPPHGPIGSVKDFFLQLVIITGGVLIALSLEGLVEWRHHRALVGEAHENIRRELTDNQKELGDEQSALDTLKKNLDNGLQRVEDLLNKRPSAVKEVNLSVSLGELSDASWQTAERAGAFAYMDYGDLQKYSGVYRLQDLYLDHQQRLIAEVAALLALARFFDMDDPAPRDLEALRERILTLDASVNVAQQLNRQLRTLYERTLAP